MDGLVQLSVQRRVLRLHQDRSDLAVRIHVSIMREGPEQEASGHAAATRSKIQESSPMEVQVLILNHADKSRLR